MPLDFESKELLSEIYVVKPERNVRITKRLRSNSFFDMLRRLEKEGVIKELATPKNIAEKLDIPKPADKGILYDILFTVNDWQKLDEFGMLNLSF